MTDFKRIKKNDSGFSLAEVMVAVGIISFVSIALANFDKIFKQGSKQASSKITQQKLVSAIDKALNNITACTNTFVGKNPNTTLNTTTVASILDENNNPVLNINDIYGGADSDGKSERSKLTITNMYVSHYEDSTSNPSQHFNRNKEMTLTVELQKSDFGEVRSVVERFKFQANLSAPGGPIVDCEGDAPVDLSEVCDLFQGSFDSVAETCRSIFTASLGGTDVRVGTNNDSALETENANVDVLGSTLLEEGLRMLPSAVAVNSGDFFTSGAILLRNDVMVGGTNFSSSGPSFGSPGFPGGMVNNSGKDVLYFSQGLGIGVSGGSFTAPEYMKVSGNISTGSAYVGSIPSHSNPGHGNYVASVATVRNIVSLLLSSNGSEVADIVGDITNTLNIPNPVGDNAINYVCTHHSNNLGRFQSSPPTVLGAKIGNECVVDVTTAPGFRRNNCQIDVEETRSQNKLDCPTMHTDNLYVGGNGVGNRIQSWSVNEFILPSL